MKRRECRYLKRGKTLIGLFHQAYRKDVNRFKLSRGNSKEHEFKKFEIFYALREKGHDIITEGIFSNNKRADVADLSKGIIYEVLKSETLKNAREKIKEYPEQFEVRFVKIKDKVEDIIVI